jgi:hypothetical protein
VTDRIDENARPDDEPKPAGKRPWHPPQFILTDIAATDVQGNAGNDGGPMNSAS